MKFLKIPALVFTSAFYLIFAVSGFAQSNAGGDSTILTDSPTVADEILPSPPTGQNEPTLADPLTRQSQISDQPLLQSPDQMTFTDQPQGYQSVFMSPNECEPATIQDNYINQPYESNHGSEVYQPAIQQGCNCQQCAQCSQPIFCDCCCHSCSEKEFDQTHRDHRRGDRTLSLFGGWNEINDDSGNLFPEIAEFEDGYLLGLSIGKRHNRWFRSELEYVYRENQEDSQDRPRTNPFFNDSQSYNGEIKVHSGMINLLVDPLGSRRIRPYAGVGVGVANLQANVSGTNLGFPFSVRNTDDVLAYQGLAGMALKVCKSAEVFSEYRYFRTTDTQLLAPGFSVFPSPGQIGKYYSHNVTVGIRYRF